MDGFAELLRRVGLDVSGLANLLRTVQVTTSTTLVKATIATGDTSVTLSHGLGRGHRGAYVVGQTAAAAVYVDLPGTSKTTITVRIPAALLADLTVHVRVF